MRRVIIAGGRDFGVFPDLPSDLDEHLKVEADLSAAYHQIYDIIGEGEFVEIVSGGAKGADAFGEEYARTWSIPVRRFEAAWTVHGKAAGPIRNAEMAAYADTLIAFWDGKSPGTKNMIHTALDRGLEVHVYRY